MKKILSLVFLVVLLVLASCKNNVEAGLNNRFLDSFNTFSGLIADVFGLKADPKKSDIKEYFSNMAKELNKTKESLVKLLKENGGVGPEVNNRDEKRGNKKNLGLRKTISITIEILEELIKGANTATAAAAASNEAIGTVFISSNNSGVADSDSVNGIAKGIRWIVEVAYGAAEKKIENKVGSNAAGTDNKDAGKLFSGGGGGDKDAARKAVAAVSAVSGDQILYTIVSAARNGKVDVGSVSDELNISGKNAQNAANPIEAAIGDSISSSSNQTFSKITRNDEIAAAIVLRGMAKGGRFFASDNAVSEVKQSAQLSILKTVTTLADLVKGVVKECLDRIVKILEEENHNKPHTAST
ncbi:hypothetical protein BLA33_04665 (plasmid) [Borreliella garinii]|uniref:variable large family protein n=1 Tax=Borreliella garinii TaxID=29519 RepID=UPI0003F8E517|nr:variable large family protein [Borreliella garinii]APQ15642.1 hypothetical protein BLA33_04665 [Borreliella garinii]AZA28411.1 hypothetical protein DB281_05140 [Borreliella garinii]